MNKSREYRKYLNDITYYLMSLTFTTLLVMGTLLMPIMNLCCRGFHLFLPRKRIRVCSRGCNQRSPRRKDLSTFSRAICLTLYIISELKIYKTPSREQRGGAGKKPRKSCSYWKGIIFRLYLLFVDCLKEKRSRERSGGNLLLSEKWIIFIILREFTKQDGWFR